MTPVTDELLQRMVNAIVDEVDPEQVILFGSRARGDNRENSDIDLIVIEAEPFGPDRSRHKEMLRLHKAVRGSRAAVDILVHSNEDVDYCGCRIYAQIRRRQHYRQRRPFPTH